jgi:uncharacterized protein (UPF0332 family)
MAFDWVEYLILAEELIGQHSRPAAQEARLRCAVSRAYYAAFCEVKNYLITKENFRPLPGRGAHKTTRDYLYRLANTAPSARAKTLNEVAASLQDLCNNRVSADYNEHQTCTLRMTEYQLLQAHEVISLLKALV